MRRFLPFAFAIVLAGCSLQGSVTETGTPPDMPSGFDGESTMLSCRMNTTEECVRRSVLSDGTVINALRNDMGEWVPVTESECFENYCYAVDAEGTEWKLEP